MRKRLLLVILVLSAVAGTLSAAPPGVYAIVGGTVHPVSGPVIERGTVIIRGGLIEAVGAGLNVPADAVVIDASGLHVYPGLIDGLTSAGIASPKGEGDKKKEPTADGRASALVSLADDLIEGRRSSGITTLVVAQSGGIFNGESVVVNLSGAPVEQSVIRDGVAQYVQFNTRSWTVYPGSLMGVISYIRQGLLDAQNARAAFGIYEKSPAGKARPSMTREVDALRPVVSGQMPVVIEAESANMIRRAAAIAQEFKLRWIVAGARESYRMTDELKSWKTPVLLSVDFPAAPKDEKLREEQSLRVIRNRVEAPSAAGILAKSGIQFALVSAPAKTAPDFIRGIRRSIAAGLSPDDALRAVTLSPAAIYGVDRQLGSLEKGKIANVVVTDAPIFNAGRKVVDVFVDGRRFEIKEEKKSTDTEEPAYAGTWSLSVRMPEGEETLEVTLAAGDESGTFSGKRFGSGSIGKTAFANSEVTFTITSNAGAETNDWQFKGTIDGNAMKGSVSSPLGTFEFSGRKPE